MLVVVKGPQLHFNLLYLSKSVFCQHFVKTAIRVLRGLARAGKSNELVEGLGPWQVLNYAWFWFCYVEVDARRDLYSKHLRLKYNSENKDYLVGLMLFIDFLISEGGNRLRIKLLTKRSKGNLEKRHKYKLGGAVDILLIYIYLSS